MAGTIITKKGLQLIAKLVASGTAMTFSRVSVGTGAVPAGYDPGSMTDLNQYKMDGSISSCSFLGDEASIIMQISSLGVETGFTITETGLYATDPDEGEILYAYLDLTKDPQYVYAENSAISKFVEITLVVKVGTVERVTAQLNPRSLLTRDGDISDTSINDLEPIETKYPVPNAGESTKVFMGKVKKYIEDTKPLDADLTMYVATTGNNTTGDGTPAKPYQTINYALNKIPKNLNGHTVGIVVSAGTYKEDVFIQGVDGDLQLLLQGDIIINNLTVTQSNLTIGSFTGSTVLLTSQWIAIKNASRVYADSKVNVNMFSTVTPTFTSTSHAMYCFDSQLYMSGIIVLTGNPSIGIAAYANSNVFLGTVTGGGMNIGLAADRSKIACMANRTTTSGVPSVGQYGGVLINGFGARIGTLSTDVTIYVATTGSDSAGDGTNAKPYKTIQYAINTLPKDLGGRKATVNIADGTYSERIVISGFYNGWVKLIGSKPEEVSSVCNIADISIVDNPSSVDIRGINFTTTTANGVYAVVSGFVIIAYCRCAVSSIWSGFSFDQTRFEIFGCLVANKGIALMTHGADGNSRYWNALSINNTVGLHAEFGSNIKKNGTQPQATIPERCHSAGSITNENGTQISEFITSGLSCAWANIRGGGYVRHGVFAGGVAMVTVDLNMVVTSALSSNQTYSIAGFPKPANSFGVAAYCHANHFYRIEINFSGVMLMQPLTTSLSVGATFTVGATYLTTS